MKTKRSISPARMVIFLILLIGACTMVLPFVWMLSTSLKEANLVYQIPPQWIPRPVDWHNYVEVWNKSNMISGLENSALVSLCVVGFGTFSSTMAAFAFAKLNFPGKRFFFMALLSTMMVPFVVLLVPQFIIYSRVGWINTLLPLIIPGSLGNASMIFFLRSYIQGLPTELLEAAKIDGCGYLGTYFSVFLPLCKPAIVSNIIMTFMGTWNDYFGPMVFINDSKKQTVQVAIAMLNSYHQTQTDVPVVMAAALVAVLPVLILFIVCQDYFTESFAMSGLKA